MKHARKDYDGIQDPSKKIPDHEPVFLIRGQDMLAIPMLRHYIRIAKQAEVNPDVIESVQKHIKRMEIWQEDVKVKKPDLPVYLGENHAGPLPK